jgi:hypothetical protein
VTVTDLPAPCVVAFAPPRFGQFDPPAPPPTSEFTIDEEVVVLEEGRAAPVAALGDMTGQAGDDEPGKAGDRHLLLSEQWST